MTAPPDDTTEGKALPETMLQPCSFDDSPEPTTASVTAEGLYALADEIRKCRKLLDLAEHSEALTKRRACTSEKSTSPYDGPSDPAEDCPRHGNPAVTAPLDDAVSLTDEDRDRIGRERIAYIRAGCVCARTVPAADFVPVPSCPIHGHVPSTDIAEDLRERLIAVIKSVRIHPQLDSAVTAMIMAGAGFHITDDEAGPLADAVLAALAGDPGDLPARTAEAIAEKFTPQSATFDVDAGEYRDATLAERADKGGLAVFFTAGDGGRSFRSPTAREVADVAMSVHQEHAARQAAELADARINLTTVQGQLTDERAHSKRAYEKLAVADAEVERLRAERDAAQQRAEAAEQDEEHVRGTLSDTRQEVDELTAENRGLRDERGRLQVVIEKLSARHQPKPAKDWIRCRRHAWSGSPGMFKQCPDCREEPITVCSNLTCCEWPCADRRAIDAALAVPETSTERTDLVAAYAVHLRSAGDRADAVEVALKRSRAALAAFDGRGLNNFDVPTPGEVLEAWRSSLALPESPGISPEAQVPSDGTSCGPQVSGPEDIREDARRSAQVTTEETNDGPLPK